MWRRSVPAAEYESLYCMHAISQYRAFFGLLIFMQRMQHARLHMLQHAVLPGGRDMPAPRISMH